ncbi:ribokinase [Actinomyces sp. 2119]|uniref:Ribokinase n=1 Tax=Actinomyces lilanjuaniae TaxID=2321394 RepID=A0ABN5PMH3_9ACTO|nr:MULTISPECIES: ribokinase [Actinomyces]AYD89474.1 ribokinase [Actinomyces lilanjuaniae]RJF43167.1 ribokinase [Actinomyces sp. 2119]
MDAPAQAASGKDGVLVVGSINDDLIVFQDRLPRRGETLVGHHLRESFGGKGANQAVQASRMGARVSLVGAVGQDLRGRSCLENLREEGIECRVRTAQEDTGVGVEHIVDGDVFATIVPGANARVDPEWVTCQEDLFRTASVVVLQNEIPAESNVQAVRLARLHGARVVYNAAPARAADPAMMRECDYLVVNEEEAQHYLGSRITDLDDPQETARAVTALRHLSPGVIMTLGERGSHVAVNGEVHHVPAVPAQVVDATGAGDSFVGAFAAALDGGRDDLGAAILASHVAARTVTGAGAQTSMPRYKDLSDEAVRAQGGDSHPAA